MTVATSLTLARFALAPVFVALLVRGSAHALWAASIVFALAALTDSVDGYLARRTGTVTPVGRALDPLADKILVVSALFSFLLLHLGGDVVQDWMVGTIVVREVVITALRAVAARRGFTFLPSRLAKWKTTLQMGFVLALLAAMSMRARTDTDPAFWRDPGDVLRAPLTLVFLAATVITLLSGLDYLWQARAVVAPAARSVR
jgi:CDP-diacylglycerol---glycerol-3-phosphate 3-phosphatidyltransferase